jgi:N utilization substance protein A
LEELSDIQGFDEETAVELQTRAREFLEAKEQEAENKRKELGVADELTEIEGLTAAMLVALGNNDVKSVEDLAGCATDDLIGWYETVDGERKRMSGLLDGFDLVADEANEIIMKARIKAGWITEDDLQEQESEPAEEEAAEVEEVEETVEKRLLTPIKSPEAGE